MHFSILCLPAANVCSLGLLLLLTTASTDEGTLGPSVAFDVLFCAFLVFSWEMAVSSSVYTLPPLVPWFPSSVLVWLVH